jgi:hypothetical protein
MSPHTYVAKLYPNASPAPASFGVCLSGGGSRALTCALGQLSALASMADPGNPGKTIMDRVNYLSSVSGGSWASVLYTFLPSNITDAQFLIAPQPPAKLYKGSATDNNPANVCYMGPNCLGTVPQQFNHSTIAAFLYTLYQWGFFTDSTRWSWFWIAGIGEIVLKRFGLYSADYDANVNYIQPAKFFSLSQSYVQNNIQNLNQGLDPSQFYLCAAGRPPLIVNTNVLQNYQAAVSAQIPVQAMPGPTSVRGQSPDGTIVGGGGVESFAFTSTLTGAGSAAGTASVTETRRYSLCDIAGCSSAFFAAFLLQYLDEGVDDIIAELKQYLINSLHLSATEAEIVAGLVKAALDVWIQEAAPKIIPLYNYWPLNQVSQPSPANQVYGFSDGGDFDNTGILGMLAQTDVSNIIAFVNSEIVLSKVGSTALPQVDPCIPLLFGLQAFNSKGQYPSWGGMNPAQPLSYVQVFSNANNEFDTVINGLYNASCAGGSAGTATAAYAQTLTTVDNPVANIQAGRQVQVLWVYNNRVNNWQNQITDQGIQTDLKQGQSGDLNSPLWNFPGYFTGEQIYLGVEAVNMLAQLSAWNVQQLQQEIYTMLGISKTTG